MDIINAVKRLERAGAENSKATKKLHEAAATVAEIIEKMVPIGVLLPRDYRVTRIKSNVGSELFLLGGKDQYGDADFWVDGIGRYLHGDFHCEIPSQTRSGSLTFARDVAGGLLEEIANFLEKRKQESEKATIALEQVVEKPNA